MAEENPENILISVRTRAHPQTPNMIERLSAKTVQPFQEKACQQKSGKDKWTSHFVTRHISTFRDILSFPDFG